MGHQEEQQEQAILSCIPQQHTVRHCEGHQLSDADQQIFSIPWADIVIISDSTYVSPTHIALLAERNK